MYFHIYNKYNYIASLYNAKVTSVKLHARQLASMRQVKK